jgi:toxin secretion/phage lysis holin
MKLDLIKYGVGGVISALSTHFGGFDSMLMAAFGAILLDYISAFIVCGYEGKLNSSVGRKGMYSKLMYFVLIAAGYLLDFILHTHYVLGGCCVFVISNELLSILENCGRIPGFKVPKVIKDAIEVLNNKGDKE